MWQGNPLYEKIQTKRAQNPVLYTEKFKPNGLKKPYVDTLVLYTEQFKPNGLKTRFFTLRNSNQTGSKNV